MLVIIGYNNNMIAVLLLSRRESANERRVLTPRIIQSSTGRCAVDDTHIDIDTRSMHAVVFCCL